MSCNDQNKWKGPGNFDINRQESFNYSEMLSGELDSTTKAQLLSNSPTNVHYFFLSSSVLAESDVLNMKEQFDEIISDLPPMEQNHWNQC